MRIRQFVKIEPLCRELNDFNKIIEIQKQIFSES